MKNILHNQNLINISTTIKNKAAISTDMIDVDVDVKFTKFTIATVTSTHLFVTVLA